MLIPFTQGAGTLALLLLAKRAGGRGLRGMAEHIKTTNLYQGDKHLNEKARKWCSFNNLIFIYGYRFF